MNLRLVPKPGVTLDDMRRLADEQGWQHHNSVPATEETPPEEIWITPDQQSGIHWIEDIPISTTYIQLEGEDQEEIADAIRKALEIYSQQELLDLVEATQTADDSVRAICLLGAGAPPTFDAEVFAPFDRAFRHPDPRVRRAAVVVSYLPGWPEFRASLEALRAVDADPMVRDLAGRVLGNLWMKKWREEVA